MLRPEQLTNTIEEYVTLAFSVFVFQDFICNKATCCKRTK